MIRRAALSSLWLALVACGDDTSSGGAGGAGGGAATAGASTTGGGASASASSGAGGGAAASTSSGAGAGSGEPFVVEALDGAVIGSNPEEEGFQRAEADVDLGEGPFASVRLVATLSTTCFPFEQWEDNPPPAGESWPASCDAFDRNFELSLGDPEDAEAPSIELVRAITPFGGPMTIEADVTDVMNGRAGPHRFAAHIATWSDPEGRVTGSDGQWTVSARFEVAPGPKLRNLLAVEPLFYGSVSEPSGLVAVPFSVPEGTVVGAIELRVTGHGGGAPTDGCIGPAEEFCRREMIASIDGAELAVLEPWRSDCELGCSDARYEPWNLDYCAENPCGLPASVRASRANWCPGSVTPPILLQGGPLDTPGEHTLDLAIPALAEGGSWQVSATFLAYGDL